MNIRMTDQLDYILTALDDLLLDKASGSANGVPLTSELRRHRADENAINESSSRYLLFSNNL